jgi:hypothetical protein
MAEVLGVDYNTLELDLDDVEQYQRVLARPPQAPDESVPVVDPLEALLAKVPEEDAPSEWGGKDGFLPSPNTSATEDLTGEDTAEASASDLPETAVTLAPIPDSPDAGAERLQTIQQMVTEHAGGQDYVAPALCAVPAQADGLFPVTDVWYIEPGLDAPEPLRIHVAQFAREIAEEASLGDCVEPVSRGIGFVCTLPSPNDALSGFGRGVLSLLRALRRDRDADAPEDFRLDAAIGPLLLGNFGQGSDPDPDSQRLSDAGLIKFFRLLRLARRLLDREAGADASGR